MSESGQYILFWWKIGQLSRLSVVSIYGDTFQRGNCVTNNKCRSSTERKRVSNGHASIHSNNVLNTWKAVLLIHCVWERAVAFLSRHSTQVCTLDVSGKNFKFERSNSSRSRETKSHQLSLLRSTGSKSATVFPPFQVKHSWPSVSPCVIYLGLSLSLLA